MFQHCGQKIKPTDIWFLANNKDCINRVLYIASCPRCLKTFTCLIETNINESKTYTKIKKGKQAIQEIELCRFDCLYTSNDLKIKKGKPCGWIYGENKEIRNKQGEVVQIRQRACDYFGQKEIVKELSIVSS